MPRKPRAYINWLKLEDRIREALQGYKGELYDPDSALRRIDDAIGEETGRGWELEGWKGGE